MKKIILCLLFVLVFFSFSYADDFNDAVEASRGKRLPSSSSAPSKKSDDDCCGDGAFGCFAMLLDESCEIAFDACCDFLSFVWLDNNFFVDYWDYPYEEDSPNYVRYNQRDGYISSRFSASTSFFLLTGLGVGNESCFEGLIFPLIGPCIDNFVFSDPRVFTEELKGNVRAGLQLSFFQTNAISVMGTFQWSMWYGNAHELLKKGGFALGLNLRSMPVKPVVFEFKNNWQFYFENVYVYDQNLTVGALVGRVEFNLGWKLLLVGNNESFTVTKRWDGITLGTRVWF